jgi:hypothetical protein
MVHARRFYKPASTLACALRNTTADRAAALAVQPPPQQQHAASTSTDTGGSPPPPAEASPELVPARRRRSPPPPCSAPELLQLLLCLDALGLLVASQRTTQGPAMAALRDASSYELAAAVVETHQQHHVPVPKAIRAMLGWEAPEEEFGQGLSSRAPRAVWLEDLLRALVPQVQGLAWRALA